MIERQRVEDRLPKLGGEDWDITSAPTDTYNCVAWIARDVKRWWHPDDVDGFYWPPELGDGDALADYIGLFEHLGFAECQTGDPEPGQEKIALYGRGDDFKHVAFQRQDGTWSSKVGELADIWHQRLDPLAGSGPFEYASIVLFMRRPRQPHPLAESGLLLPGPG